MAQAIKTASNRKWIITPADHGLILDFGAAATSQSTGTFVFQFNPDVDCDYSVVVMGRTWGAAAADADVPFMPIPYRRVTLNNVASDYAIVSDAVSGASMIQVPANWAIGMLVACTTGKCSVVSWDLAGSSNP